MVWLVVETFVLMAVFVACGVLIGAGLRQFAGRPKAVVALAGHGGADAVHGDDVAAPVVVPVARPDAPEHGGPVVEPIAADEAPAEAPALAPVASSAEASATPGDGSAPVILSAAEAVIDPTRAATADQVGVRPTALAHPRDGRADDLKVIKGIGPQNEARLNALGVFHFDQIAAWTTDEARWVGSYLAFPGRIEREDWVGQARALSPA